jgi:NAD-dependent dihydropyrimidine dehydrogenase PreA subunit
MIEKIDLEKCTGCGKCIESCSLDVIRLDEKQEKAVIKYLEDCMTCYSCERDCPEGAIYVGPERAGWVVLPW